MWPGRGRGRGPPIRDDVPWRDGEDSWEGPQEILIIPFILKKWLTRLDLSWNHLIDFSEKDEI